MTHFDNECDPVFYKPDFCGLDGQTEDSVDWVSSCSLGQGTGHNALQSGL